MTDFHGNNEMEADTEKIQSNRGCHSLHLEVVDSSLYKQRM